MYSQYPQQISEAKGRTSNTGPLLRVQTRTTGPLTRTRTTDPLRPSLASLLASTRDEQILRPLMRPILTKYRFVEMVKIVEVPEVPVRKQSGDTIWIKRRVDSDNPIEMPATKYRCVEAAEKDGLVFDYWIVYEEQPKIIVKEVTITHVIICEPTLVGVKKTGENIGIGVIVSAWMH